MAIAIITGIGVKRIGQRKFFSDMQEMTFLFKYYNLLEVEQITQKHLKVYMRCIKKASSQRYKQETVQMSY